jgi:hypothetical protein
MQEVYASVGLTVTIRRNYLYSPLGVGDVFDNLPNGHIMRRVHVSTEGTTVFGGPMGTPDFSPDVFETASSKYEAYDERLRALAAHRHSHTALRIHQHYNCRFGHFARTVPHDFGRSEGYVSILERADKATLDVAAEILGLKQLAYPATPAPRCFFSYVSDAWGWETCLPWQMRAMSERRAWQWDLISIFLHRKMLACAGIPTTKFGWSRQCMDG